MLVNNNLPLETQYLFKKTDQNPLRCFKNVSIYICRDSEKSLCLILRSDNGNEVAVWCDSAARGRGTVGIEAGGGAAATVPLLLYCIVAGNVCALNHSKTQRISQK